ncbi:MAG TPA: resolvase [Lachnospiraceae bacterium]|nr:resolvase [Lachnospiraceae bacterium]
MKYGYARVSTKNQDLDIQLQHLKSEKCEIIYQEKYTGAKSDRPEFQKCLAALKEGDTLVVTKLDRLARNTKEGIEIIDDLFNRNVKVHVLNVGLLENTTLGRFFLQNMLAFAEMERSIILERTQEGLNKARQNPNFKEGRPKKFSKHQIKLALKLMDSHSVRQVSEMTGISMSTLFRAKKTYIAETN